MMRRLLQFADSIDAMSEQIGQALKWLVLASSLISAGVAVVRYGLHTGSNAWLEIQWYMFGAMFLLAPATRSSMRSMCASTFSSAR